MRHLLVHSWLIRLNQILFCCVVATSSFDFRAVGVVHHSQDRLFVQLDQKLNVSLVGVLAGGIVHGSVPFFYRVKSAVSGSPCGLQTAILGAYRRVCCTAVVFDKNRQPPRGTLDDDGNLVCICMLDFEAYKYYPPCYEATTDEVLLLCFQSRFGHTMHRDCEPRWNLKKNTEGPCERGRFVDGRYMYSRKRKAA